MADSDVQRWVEFDILREKLYNFLAKKGHIFCDFDRFTESVEIFRKPHAVYVNVFAGISEDEEIRIMNQLLNLTADDLKDYQNAVDWLVQQHKQVRYIKEFDAYIYFDDSLLDYED